MSSYFNEHRVGCVLGILVGITGIVVTIFYQEVHDTLVGPTVVTTKRASAAPSPESSLVAAPLSDESRNPSATPKAEPTGLSLSSPVSVRQSVYPSTNPPPIQEPTQSRGTEPRRAPDNDIGKSKANDFYEITLENASASSNPVHLDICNFNVPSGQKAILVRFAIRLSPPPRTNEEILRLGYTQTTDFILTDDRGRRVDPECLVTGMVLSGSGRAVNRTLAYLIPAGSQHMSFRFQKSGAGQPIVFDLSGLD